MPGDERTTSISDTSDPGRHKCFLCNRSYERQDHLSRHLKSHDNDRAYKCPDCGKGFNRADLLNRHRAAHAKAANGEALRRRAEKACKPCIAAKTKCEDERPCKRCKTRNMDCIESEGREPPPTPPASTWQGETTDHEGDYSTATSAMAPPAAPMQHSPGPDDVTDAAAMPDLQGLNTFHPSQFDDFAFPAFFEQVMTTDLYTDVAALPPNVTNFTRDLDFNFDVGTDFNFMIENSRPEPQQIIRNPVNDSDTEALRRSEVYEKSPWSWTHWPPQKYHAFSDQSLINVVTERLRVHDQVTSPSARNGMVCTLDQHDRDRMLQLVTETVRFTHVHRVSITAFPPLQLLEDLVNVLLLEERHAIDARIHVASFKSRETRSELLIAMVAAGSTFVALPTVNRMGLVFQEIARLSLAELFESDNSHIRNLQVLQAFLLWIDQGIWSGFRRKTELAMSFLLPLVTMLSGGNAFTRLRYIGEVPLRDNGSDAVEQQWKAWVERESLKRLSIRAFLHDGQVALCHQRNPLMSAAQMLIPLPASKVLWHASSAQAWHEASRGAFQERDLPPLAAVFGDITILDQYASFVDVQLCCLAAFHALARDVWAFRQQSQLMAHKPKQGRQDRQFSHLSRQRDLAEDLSALRAYCDMHDPKSEIVLTLEFLSMTLHVSLENIQTFSGKSGELEARKIYPQIRDWSAESESRTAVWHAGQVFRAARNFEKTRLRDSYALCVYHAALTLWVYGMVTSNTARRSGIQTPAGDAASSLSSPYKAPVYLDGADGKSAQAFRLLNQGLPVLQRVTPNANNEFDFCALQRSKAAMAVGTDVLKQNYCNAPEGLPPLVENLASLMEDLARPPSQHGD